MLTPDEPEADDEERSRGDAEIAEIAEILNRR
jgi:hypothetical protein